MKAKKKIIRKLLWGAAILIVFYVFFGGESNLYKLWKLHQNRAQLLAQVKELELEKKDLSRQIDLLNNDLDYIEKMARTLYKMGKPGERIYIIKQ